MLTDIASLVNQVSFVAEGMRIKISLSPKISAVQMEVLLTGLFVPDWNIFPNSIAGTTARLLGPGDCVTLTVTVLVEVAVEVDVVVTLTTAGGKIAVVVEIGTADMILLLIDMAGLEEKR